MTVIVFPAVAIIDMTMIGLPRGDRGSYGVRLGTHLYSQERGGMSTTFQVPSAS